MGVSAGVAAAASPVIRAHAWLAFDRREQARRRDRRWHRCPAQERGHRRPLVAPDLLEPLDQPLRRRVLGVDRQRPLRHPPRSEVVAALEGDPRQPHDRDGVARVGVGGLAIEAVGLVHGPMDSVRSAWSSSSIIGALVLHVCKHALCDRSSVGGR